MALDIQKSPEDISTKTETAPSRAPERGYQILGDAPEAQAAYITRMDALAEEKSKAEKQATAATTPEAKAEAQDAIDEAVLSQARESRMTFIRTHGGLDSDSAENRTKRQTLLKNRGSFDEVLPSDLYALSYTSGYDLVPLLMYNV
ncbi:MAG TPA: hypothetical protein PK765_02160 [bacterium]|nr:hypothetical protein [bacterium]